MTDKKQEGQKFDYAFLAEQEVHEKTPWIDDRLGRQRFANGLANLAKGAGGSPFVVGVHGEWGSGKTFMLRRWQRQMENDGCKTIYFNAWEDDFHANPLVAITGQIWESLKGGSLQEIGKSLKQGFMKAAGKKTLAAVWLTEQDLSSTAEQTVNSYMETRKMVNDLRERLKELGNVVKGKTGVPLIFVIDELDRCCPVFAIELLERVKHIFSVPGIVFVLGINKTQLEKSIKSVYGEIDAENYLRRFFDMVLVLPPSAPSRYSNYLMDKYKIINHIADSGVHRAKYGSRSYSGSWQMAIEDIYAVMADCMELSLREIEHAFRMLLFVIYSKEIKPENRHVMQPDEGKAVLFLIFLKIKNSELYRDFIHGGTTSKDVIDYMLNVIRVRGNVKWYDRRHILLLETQIENVFYCLIKSKHVDATRNELKCCIDGSKPAGGYKYLSERIWQKGKERGKELMKIMDAMTEDTTYRISYLDNIAELLEWGDI